MFCEKGVRKNSPKIKGKHQVSTQVFHYEFCKICKDTHFTGHLRRSAPENVFLIFLIFYPPRKCNYYQETMSHFVKSVQIRSFSGPYFPVFSPNTGKYGPEKTPYLDTFHAVSLVAIVLCNTYFTHSFLVHIQRKDFDPEFFHSAKQFFKKCHL